VQPQSRDVALMINKHNPMTVPNQPKHRLTVGLFLILATTGPGCVAGNRVPNGEAGDSALEADANDQTAVTLAEEPHFSEADLQANEEAAIGTLLLIAVAQFRVNPSAEVDTDNDGEDEFAYIGELAGVAALRTFDPARSTATIGTEFLDPPFLPTPFAAITADSRGEGVVDLSGYYFKMFLPDASAGGTIRGIAEAGSSGTGGAVAGRLPDSDNGEVLWCCYGWPVEAGRTGNRVFFINQEGDILQFANASGVYSGIKAGMTPPFDAAYSSGSGGGDMMARLGISAMLAADGEAANDGNTWTVVGW
jgi:hypothetical protein